MSSSEQKTDDKGEKQARTEEPSPPANAEGQANA